MKEVQGFSAPHPGDVVIVGKKEADAGALPLPGLDANANAQLIAQPLAEVEPEAGGAGDGPAVCAGESFVKDAGQVLRRNADAVILQQKDGGPFLAPARKAEGGRRAAILDGVANELVQNETDPLVIGADHTDLTRHRDGHLMPAQQVLVAGYGGVDHFRQIDLPETVVLLSKLNTKQHIEVELNLDELDLTAAESKATYDEIKAYVLEKYGLKVSSLYISQVKRKCGLDMGQNYNLSKKEDAKVPQCPPEKEAAIVEALKHFHMI